MKFIAASIAAFICIGLAVQAVPTDETNVQEQVEEIDDVNVGVWDIDGEDDDDDNDLDILDNEENMNMGDDTGDLEVGARKKRSYGYGGYRKHHKKYGYKPRRRHGKYYYWKPYYWKPYYWKPYYYKKPYYSYGKHHGHRKY